MTAPDEANVPPGQEPVAGPTILIEVTPSLDEFYEAETMRDGGLSGRVKQFSQAQLDQALATAKQLALETRKMIAELQAEAPDDDLAAVEAEFGLKFNGELQAYIAKANAEASMTIKLTWQAAKE
jgi:hypothetical protein